MTTPEPARIVVCLPDMPERVHMGELPGNVNVVLVTDEPAALPDLSDVDFIVPLQRVRPALLDLLTGPPSQLRVIQTLSAGVDWLVGKVPDHVAVCNARGIYDAPLAEWVIGAIMWFAKDFQRLATNHAHRKWDPFPVQRLEGATLGIIGYGSIGEAIAKRAQIFGMHLLTVRRNGGTPLDEVLSTSDYVVVSTPLTDETRLLINRGRIATMRHSAVLINISRGAVVDEEALIDALRAKTIRGAALDVYQTEPLPETSPLWSLDNVLLSPHSADQITDSQQRKVELFTRNLRLFLCGEILENQVDKSAGY